MSNEIRVPVLGESVTEATVGQWFKNEGDTVKIDEPIVELETDKVTLEVPSPVTGTLGKLIVKRGDVVEVGALLTSISLESGETSAAPKKQAPAENKTADEPKKEKSDAEILVPVLGESVTEATVGTWFKSVGDNINADEPLVELETDKVTLEVPAPISGVLTSISAEQGETVEVGAPLGAILSQEGTQSSPDGGKSSEIAISKPSNSSTQKEMPPAPSARKMMAEQNLGSSELRGSGKRGQILKGDVLVALSDRQEAANRVPAVARSSSPADDEFREERVPMNRLRQTIARRLKDAQNTAAMLTTFNEVDMTTVLNVRKQYKDLFEAKHGVKLGFMGFFVKACVQALKELPAVNAEVDGTDIIYKNYYHIGVAVGTDKGLVVPVVRNADQLGLAEIEKTIGNFSVAARNSKLQISDMQGGTFTLSNGGVYGSLMSTPILNAPQSGILGMHKIQERPVVVNGKVKARPMMYLALSYDHRIVDGKEAVTFLVRVKESLEDPQRLILDL